METIIIGKPAVNVYLPLQEFPQEGDLFLIKGKNESVGNIGATSACLLAKWGSKVHFTGVVGNDAYAEKIRDTFKTFKVDSKYMETDYESGTSVNYNVLNAKTGIVTKILYNNPDSQLKKYKYDFIPNFAIIDGTDFAGAHALLNNNGSCKTVFYGRIGDKDTIAMSKRCTWAVVTEKFVEMMTKERSDGSAESYVYLYQKIVDASGKSNYIVILNSHKILYCVDGKVKMLPEMKINVADYSSFDSIFVGALSYCLMNEINIDDAIKFANTAAAISLAKVGEVPSIPELNEVIDNSGLKEKLGFGSNDQSVANTTSQPVESISPIATVNVAPVQNEVNPVMNQEVVNQQMTNMNTEQVNSNVSQQPQMDVTQTFEQPTPPVQPQPIDMPQPVQSQEVPQSSTSNV